jgi:hypothetical protein
MRPWTPFTIQAATPAIPRGAKATMMRRRTPQVTTKGPEFHKILRRGGRLRKARTRSPHALLTFCLVSGIKIYDVVRSARATPVLFQINRASSPSMRRGVVERIFEIRPEPTEAGARPLTGLRGRSISARISVRGGNARSFDNWCLSQAAGASIGRKVDYAVCF